ncbi:MAG: ABC transporter permease [Kofleriaceae bacterium]|nr:ABC transporter permease [Kofleriaceae bacterium]
MLVAALKLVAILAGLAAVVAIVAVLVIIAIALVRMGIVSLVQWRDLFSFDRWTEVLVTIGRNKLRTALTMISVAWGILVLVSLLGLGVGLDHGMKKNFARDATNAVWVMANKTSVPHGGYDVGRIIKFENADYEAAKKVKGIDHLSAEHFIGGGRWGSSLAVSRGAKANTFEINAVYADTYYLEAQEMVRGRFLTTADIREKRKSAVLGKVVADFLFGPENPIGEWIVMGGVPFQVVGIFHDQGGDEQERKIYIPVSTAQLAYNGGEKLGVIEFTVGNAGEAEAKVIIDQITGQLAEKYNFDPHDSQAVRVHNNIEQFGRFQKLFWMISTFVVVIGLGTLAAGVVGVSNIMMIAVKERTKEIGVRKALGATPSSIIFMIIQEAIFLTAIAGLLGLASGLAILEAINRWVDSDFIVNASIDIKTGVGAAAFLVVAGALAGYFPARAAARVNPIHALRDV